MNQKGTEAKALFDAAMFSLKKGDLESAELVASQMWVKSDAWLIRSKIASFANRREKE